MYQLQLLFNNRVLIPNQHRVKSIQSRADSTVSDQDLEIFLLSVETLILLTFVGPIQAC